MTPEVDHDYYNSITETDDIYESPVVKAKLKITQNKKNDNHRNKPQAGSSSGFCSHRSKCPPKV